MESLCESANCLLAVRQTSFDTSQLLSTVHLGYVTDSLDKIYWTLGVVVNVALLACAAAILVAGIVWKVFPFVQFYFFLLVVISISLIVEVSSWALSGAFSYVVIGKFESQATTLVFVASGSSVIFCEDLF